MPLRIGVVGLGIAGLRAAMLLELQGHEVVLFEARNRVGGRLQTIFQSSGAIYEAGGEWLDSDHHRVLGLLRELGISPQAGPTGSRRFAYGGDECSENTVWDEAREDEIRLDSAARELCRALRTPVWANVDQATADLKDLGSFIYENSRSARGRWWLNAKARSVEGDDPEKIGLLGWLGFFKHYLDREGAEMSAYRVPGGSCTLLDRILKWLRAAPQYGHQLRRISHDDTGVKLQFDPQEATVDAAILTMPPPLLERVVFDPPLSQGKRCALEASRMSRAIKVVLQFERAWWLDVGWNGSMQTDRAFQQSWDGTLGGEPVLSCYICGDAADFVRSKPDPVGFVLADLAEVFPTARPQFMSGWMHDWIADPFSQGAFSHLPPRYVLEHLQHLSPPEGRVYFAGEYTSEWLGFIEGALQSAERVVEELGALT